MAEAAIPTHESKIIHWPPGMKPEEQSTSVTTAATKKSAQPSTGACDACRARKVRCLANESSMSNKCQRCARAGRECVYTVHSKTRRRKRTDTRVKELEEKVKNLSMLLERGKLDSKNISSQSLKSLPEADDAEHDDDDDDEEYSEEASGDEPREDALPPAHKPSFDGQETYQMNSVSAAKSKRSTPEKHGVSRQNSRTSQHALKAESQVGSTLPDVIERGVITIDKAQQLIDRYIHVLSPHYPAVVLPQGMRATDLRKKRPVLFIAVLAAAAGNEHPAVNLALNQEILQLYAKRVAIKGEKSLELVQSILISILWYYPPERFEELKFHQYIHMAATMAMDIGMGRRPRNTWHDDTALNSFDPKDGYQETYKSGYTASSNQAPDSCSMESRRTLLACYLSCSNVSISLRMPNMLRWTSWMEDCLKTLETSSDAAPSDSRLTAWVRIQRVMEECNNTFSLDDPGNTASLSDQRVQQTLKGYEQQLELLRKSFGSVPGLINGFLELNIHINNMYLHEIALHPEHDAEDFRPPFFLTSSLTKPNTTISIAYVNAVMECVTSAQTVLKMLIDMQWETVRALPAFLFPRMLYAVVVLIKLHMSTYSPDSELGKIVDRETLMTQMYAEKTLMLMKRVAGDDGKCLIGAKFYAILEKLVGWFRFTLSQPGGPVTLRPSIEPGKAMDSHYTAQLASSQTQINQAYPAFGGKYSPPPSPLPKQDHEFFLTISPSHSLGLPPPTTPPPAQQGSSEPPNNAYHSRLNLDNERVIGLQDSSHQADHQNLHHNLTGPDYSNAQLSDATTTASQVAAATAALASAASTTTDGLGHNTPATDYSSPEFMDLSSSTAARLPYGFPMEVDASMFSQLEGVDPFSYHQNLADDWIFDGMNVDWTSLPMADMTVMPPRVQQ